MIAGAGDNTNCFYAQRVSEKMGGKAAQMAKAVMLYSPWQFLYWYDRPEGSPYKKGGAGSSEGIIIENDEIKFFDILPTVWDDTKVLEGKIGEYATIARRNGDDWFLGSLTANNSRETEIPLGFLDKGKKYRAVVFSQDKDDLKKDRVRMEKLIVTEKSVLSKTLLMNSGLAVYLRKM
jgi:alpha-glucosidase